MTNRQTKKLFREFNYIISNIICFMARNQEKAQSLLNKFNSYKNKIKNLKDDIINHNKSKSIYFYHTLKKRNTILKNISSLILKLYIVKDDISKHIIIKKIKILINKKNKIEKFLDITKKKLDRKFLKDRVSNKASFRTHIAIDDLFFYYYILRIQKEIGKNIIRLKLNGRVKRVLVEKFSNIFRFVKISS